MTPLQAAINERDVLISKFDKNRKDIQEFHAAVRSLAEANVCINDEIIVLNKTVSSEQDKELEAKHKAMAAELTAAGYKVAVPIKEGQPILFGMPIATGSMQYPQPQQLPKDHPGFRLGDLVLLSAFTTALSGGGKAPGMNTPGTGAGSAQPAPKLGGVHGVGEGWYKPLIYDAQGVKLEHDFAVNTRNHHEARDGWWLKHVPSGAITKGFPNEAEAYRWIQGRTQIHGKDYTSITGADHWYEGVYPGVK